VIFVQQIDSSNDLWTLLTFDLDNNNNNTPILQHGRLYGQRRWPWLCVCLYYDIRYNCAEFVCWTDYPKTECCTKRKQPPGSAGPAVTGDSNERM